ncbi:hypothetical protein BGX38DRAFT_798152 [Terfezia claveryi]|nr:hypothetical protein BGX38DRAFT_798152 [Terfezia claveryi]
MPRKKRVVATGDGWSSVKSGPSPRPEGVDPLHTLNTSTSTSRPVEPPSKSYEEVLASYKKYRETLRSSEAWKKVMTFVDTILIPQVVKKGGRLKKCVCLGLGSLEAGLEDIYRNSHYQLILLEALIEAFGWRSYSVTVEGVSLIAQDPEFNEVDRQLLRDIAGFEVVQTPTAFELIDDSTFLFAPHVEDTFYSIALAKKPCLTFGNSLDHYLDMTIKDISPAILKVFGEHQQKHLKFDYPVDWNSTPQPECKAFCLEVFYYALPNAMGGSLDNLLENLDINVDKLPQEKSPTKSGSQKEEPLTEDPTNVLEDDRTGEQSKEILQY